MAQEKVYDDVEVHDMKENPHNPASKEENGAPIVWKALSIVIAMLAIVYDLPALQCETQLRG